LKVTDAANHRRAGPANARRRRHPLARLGQAVTIGVALAASLLLLVSAQAGVAIDRISSALLSVAVLGLVQAVAWPLLAGLAVHKHPAVLPLLAFALSALTLAALGRFVPGLDVHVLGGGVLAILLLTIVHAVVSLLIAVTDDVAFERFAVRPRADRQTRPVGTEPGASPPGLILLEINGLAEPILREAIGGGHMPTVARWLNSGRYRLVEWECDLPSQISAGQAGILHGDNFDIPAFRWYDKATRTIVVSNRRHDGAARIERQVSNGRGLLAGDGACHGTLLSGDALDRRFTCSAVGERGQCPPERTTVDLGWFGWARLGMLFAWEVAVELGQGLWGVFGAGRASLQAASDRALARAFAAVGLRELCVQTVIGDMLRGVPAICLSFAGYDAVAHRAGIRSEPAFRVLRAIDRQLALVERAGRHAARSYELVVFSGHGQSQGAIFQHTFGHSLGEIVQELVPDSTVLVEQGESEEAIETARTLLADAAVGSSWSGRRLVRAVERASEHDAAARGRARRPAGERDGGGRELLVLTSGTLGLVSFPAWPHRLTHEELAARFPRLIPGLVAHEGIAFVLVTSALHGATVIGATGTAYLDDERIEGEDPLASFGPHAARHLRRHSLFANCPDILVNGHYDVETDEVVSFEATIGAHGGLGGQQARPFLLYPSHRSVSAPLIGAHTLHAIFQGWRPEPVVAPGRKDGAR
jgi:hypothetical protein